MPKQFTAASFTKEVEQSKGVVVVDFWAPWCGPCRALSPTIDALEKENKDVVVGKLNIDEAQAIAQEYNISTIPTVIVFKNGLPVCRTSSGVTKAKLQAMIDDAVNPDHPNPSR